MFDYTADELYAIVTSQEYTTEQKLQVILDLKQFIKKLFVELSEVNRYFESLKYALKSTDHEYTLATFGTVCHLVKRVGMQDPNSLRGCSKTVLPILVNKLLDDRPSIRLQAKKTLEIYWLATPSTVENHIRDGALIHSNPKIRSEAIVFLSDLIELNKNFNFSTFLPNLVNLLRDDFIEVVKNVEVLLIKYHTLNRSKLPDMIKEMKSQKIERKIAVPIIKELDPMLSNAYTTESKPLAAAPRSTIDTFNNLSRLKRSTTSFGTRSSKIPTPVSSLSRASMAPTTGSSSVMDVESVLASIPTTKLDNSITAVEVDSSSDFKRDVEALLAPFEEKETEFNWSSREKSIIKFRGLVIGNAETFPEELIQCTRLLQDGIFKTISSLRTTLSSNGCQLVKELAVHLNKSLDPLVETLFQPLAALTSSTKRIASSNAYGSLCVLVSHTSFNSRVLNQCYQMYQDKNTQPRLYSSTLLQVFILKHSAKIDQLNMEIIAKWISKGIADPNTTVRESMRSTYWLFSRIFQETAETIYQKQDNNVKKALDRAKPANIQSSNMGSAPGGDRASMPTNLVNKRPSIRDFVAAKQKEKRKNTVTSHKQDDYSFMEAASQQIHQDKGRAIRLGISQRTTAGRASSAGSIMSSSAEPLPQKISKGASRNELPFRSTVTPSSRVSSLPHERILENNLVKPESETERMTRLLQSALTKERIEGLEILKKMMNGSFEIPDLSAAIQNLIILDPSLVKPLIQDTRFFNCVSLDLALKIIAINRAGLEILNTKYGTIEIAQALINLIALLDNIHFDTAPSTMFHIKHKSLLLNFCIPNLHKIAERTSFKPSVEFFTSICKTLFPMSITDYPCYDELIIQLQASNPELFERELDSSSSFIQGSIRSILSSFKDDFNRTIQSGGDGLDNRLNEMTMINPLAKQATDPKLSLKAGFKTDMTMVVSSFQQSKKPEMTTIADNKEDSNDKMDVDYEEKKRIAYICDIFQESANSEPVVKDDDKMELDTKEEEVQPLRESNSNNSTPLIHQSDVQVISQKNSPFIEHEPNVSTDDPTTTITHQISDIYISPEKRPMEIKSSKRRSITELIHATDPFFSKQKKKITIFEDTSDQYDTDLDFATQKMLGLHLNHLKNQKQPVLASPEDITKLLKNLNDESVTVEDLNNIMVYLYYSSSSPEMNTWMGEEGFTLVLNTILLYFTTSEKITREICFKGLTIFNELLELDFDIPKLLSMNEVINLLNVLFMIIDNFKSTKNEIYITVEEILDNLLRLEMRDLTETIIDQTIQSLKHCNSTVMNIFLLLTLVKALSKTDLLLVEQILQIDDALHNLLLDQEVEVRRLTVMAYSKLMRNLNDLNEGRVLNGDEVMKIKTKETLDTVFSKLSSPEKNLIFHYSEHFI